MSNDVRQELIEVIDNAYHKAVDNDRFQTVEELTASIANAILERWQLHSIPAITLANCRYHGHCHEHKFHDVNGLGYCPDCKEQP